MKKIRIFITDDHALFRAGVVKALEQEPSIELSGEADSLNHLMESENLKNTDVLLLDISLGEQSGLDALPLLKKNFPNLEILLLSMHNKPFFLKRSINCGVSGYLLKQSPPQRLIEAVNTVYSGRKYIDPELSESIFALLSGSGSSDGCDTTSYNRLSRREQQIFRLLAEGQIPQLIAKDLFISRKTVENHRANILSKLKISSTAELIQMAEELGVI